jgi:hypothetical protein
MRLVLPLEEKKKLIISNDYLNNSERFIYELFPINLKPKKGVQERTIIGIGRRLEHGINEEEAFLMLKNDVKKYENLLREELSWFSFIPENYQIVLIALCFIFTPKMVLKQKLFLSLLENRNNLKASTLLLSNKGNNWYLREKEKIEELVKLLRKRKGEGVR